MANEIFEAIRAGDAERVTSLLAADPPMHARAMTKASPQSCRRFTSGARRSSNCSAGTQARTRHFRSGYFGRHNRLRSLLRDHPDLVCTYSADGFTPLHLASFFSQPASGAKSC